MRLYFNKLLIAIFVAAALSVTAQAARADGVVCSNTSFQGDNGYMAAYQDVDARRLYRCPAGATKLVFVYAGTTAFGTPTREVSNQSDFHLTIAVETGLAVPDSAGPARPMTALSGTKIPVLCGGQAACTIPAGGLLRTDPVSVRVPRGGIIAIDEHFEHSQAASGPRQPTYGGSLQIWGPDLLDFTRTAATPTPWNPAGDMGPQAIIGTPLTPTISACIIGDSRALGIAGVGLGYAAAASGGTGFTPDDVGQIMENISSGASPDDTYSPATYVIRGVKNGAVSSFFVWDSGHYVLAGQDGNATPNGIQSTRPLGTAHGTGFTVSVSPSYFSSSAGLFYDAATTATGYVQKGLADGNIPATSFSRSSDSLADWLAGDAARLAAITASGCTVAIIELGGNDVRNGSTAAQIEASYVRLATQVKAAGVARVYGMTILPNTLSSNGYRDAAGQSYPVASQEAVRQQVNQWIRARHRPFSDEFDTALKVEVGADNMPRRNGGRWITNGRAYFPTLDQLHLNVGTSILAASELSSHIARLQP